MLLISTPNKATSGTFLLGKCVLQWSLMSTVPSVPLLKPKFISLQQFQLNASPGFVWICLCSFSFFHSNIPSNKSFRMTWTLGLNVMLCYVMLCYVILYCPFLGEIIFSAFDPSRSRWTPGAYWPVSVWLTGKFIVSTYRVLRKCTAFSSWSASQFSHYASTQI